MSRFKKKIITLTAIVSVLLATTGTVNAEDYTYCGGRGYSEYRTCPNLAPGIALGIIALAAIIAVAVQNTSNVHGHCHNN